VTIALTTSGYSLTYGAEDGSLGITDNTSGENRIAVFSCQRYAGSGGFPPAPISVTYDGVAMTLAGTASAQKGANMCLSSTWYLEGFNLGPGAKTVAWDTTYANYEMLGVCANFRGVKSRDSNHTNYSNDGTTPLLTDGSFPAGGVLVGGFRGCSNITPDAGAVSIYSNAPMQFLYKTADTITNSMATNAWSAAGLSLIPSMGGGGARWFFSKMQDFYRDLRAGLIPPDVLQRRYRDLVAI